MINLSPYPFIRYFIPFTAGILILNMFGFNYFIFALPVVCILIYSFVNFHKSIVFKQKYHWLYDISLFGLLLFVGWLAADFDKPDKLPEDILDHPITFQMQIEDIEQHNTTTNLIALAYINSNKYKILTTLKGNKYNLSIGDILVCNSQIERIENPSIPDAFDYAQYMEHQNILYRTYLKTDRLYKKITHENTLKYYAHCIRTKIIQQIRELRLGQASTNFIITLFTGDKKFIDQETREIFSSAGIAHVLAISGLHIVILCFILNILLKPLKWANQKNLGLIISLLIIWIFTYVTGFSTSAIRASIMVTLLFSSKIIHRRYNIINSLFISATIIILFSPSAIYDIGFQLSYSAVLGIICFAKKFTFGKRGTLMCRLSEMFAVTLSAQIGTSLVILYYFNTLSLSFFIANIVILSLLPVFILLVLLVLLISGLGIIIPTFNWLIDNTYNFFNDIAVFSTAIPFTQFDKLYINGISTLALFSSLILFGIWLSKREIWLLKLVNISLLVGCTMLVYDRVTVSRHGIFIASDYSATNVVYYHNEIAYVINVDQNIYEAETFLKKNPRFFIKHGIDSTVIVNKTFTDEFFFFKYPIIKYQNATMAIAKGNLNKNSSETHKIKCNSLIISKYYYNKIKDLPRYFITDQTIIPINIYDEKKAQYIQDLERYKIPYRILSDQNIIWIKFN